MIVKWVIDAVVSVLTGILGLLPEWSFPAEVTSFGSTLGSLTGWANGYFPLTHLGICLAIFVGTRVVMSSFGVLRFLYDRLPFKAT